MKYLGDKNCSILLKGMKFSACHGVLDAEKEKPQSFIVDAHMILDFREAAVTDDLHKSVNYARVYEIVDEVIHAKSVDLIERLCYKVMIAIYEEFTQIESLFVTVHKPNAPIDGDFEDVSVSMELHRNSGDV